MTNELGAFDDGIILYDLLLATLVLQMNVALENNISAKPEITLNNLHAGNRLHRQDIQRNHPALATQLLNRIFRPAAGCRAKIDDCHAGFENAILLLDFDQLVNSTRTVAFLLCTTHILIIEMLIQPALAAFGSCHDARYFQSTDERR